MTMLPILHVHYCYWYCVGQTKDLVLLPQQCCTVPSRNRDDIATNSLHLLLLLTYMCGPKEGFGIVITTILCYCANRNHNDSATNSSYPLLLLTCMGGLNEGCSIVIMKLLGWIGYVLTLNSRSRRYHNDKIMRESILSWVLFFCLWGY